MADCRVYRAPSRIRLGGSTKKVKLLLPGQWYAVCAVCEARCDRCVSGTGYGRFPDVCRSRKQAKDALHQHMVEEHGLGQVGRREAAGTHGRA